MKQSTLNNIQHIVQYMDVKGWNDKIALSGSLEKEMKSYCTAIYKVFINLLASSMNIAEAKYTAYIELLNNLDQAELHDGILKKHAPDIQEKEKHMKDEEDKLSELLFMLTDLQERIKEIGSLPQSVPASIMPGAALANECA